MHSKLPSISEEEESGEPLESMDDDFNCTSNDDTYRYYMSKLIEAIGKCLDKSMTQLQIIDLQNRIYEFKNIYSEIIDKFLKLNIHNDEKKIKKFNEFYTKFEELVIQNEYIKTDHAGKLSMLQELATEYLNLNDYNHKNLKNTIKEYLIDIKFEALFLPGITECSINSDIFDIYQKIIATIEDITICNKRLSGNVKNLFIRMYNIYYDITQHESNISGSGGKKKSRRKARKLNKKKSIRKKSHKRKRRTRKY